MKYMWVFKIAATNDLINDDETWDSWMAELRSIMKPVGNHEWLCADWDYTNVVEFMGCTDLKMFRKIYMAMKHMPKGKYFSSFDCRGAKAIRDIIAECER